MDWVWKSVWKHYFPSDPVRLRVTDSLQDFIPVRYFVLNYGDLPFKFLKCAFVSLLVLFSSYSLLLHLNSLGPLCSASLFHSCAFYILLHSSSDMNMPSVFL